MKTFVIILKERQSGTLSDELLKAHVEHLKMLSKSGKLVFCGPFRDSPEAIKIIKVENHSEAEKLANADPFTHQGYYRKVEIKEVEEANLENNFLFAE